MKHLSLNKYNQKSGSPSPNSNSRSRSRSPSPMNENEREIQSTDNPHNRHRNNHNQKINPEEGKLYLANIPASIPQKKIKEEFQKYGKILDHQFRKKTTIQNSYYYGYITFSRKSEAEQAMNNLTKEYNWTVQPFNKEGRERNNANNRERNLNNLNNNISNLNNLNNFNINPNGSSIQNDEKNNNINGGIKVREILVGNLPSSTTEKDLYKEFFIFGEISKIELKTIEDKKSAFIKYRLINSANKAIEKNNNMNYKGNIITVNLSNINQRRDIKGNEMGYELGESNCKLILVCLNKNINPINEENAINIFEKYGKIKEVLIKNINNKNHIFAEYYKPEHAKIAIDELNKDIELKKLLGDENCEINYYFKNKSNEINPYLNMNANNEPNNINANPNINFQNNGNNNINSNINLMNQNLMMQKMGMNNPAFLLQLMTQNNLLNNKLNINNKSQISDLNQINNINKTNNLINTNNSQIKPNLNVPLQYNTRLPLYPNFPGFNLPQNPRNNFPNQFPPNSNAANLQLLQALLNKGQMNFNNMNNMNPNVIPNYMNANVTNMNKNIIKDNNNTNEVNDILNQLMTDKNNQKNNSNNNSDTDSINGSHQSTEEMEFEKEYSLEGENLQIIWNGFLTKNGKDRTNVDMYKIRGNIDDSYFKEITINVFNKISYDEVMRRRELGLVAISPQSITQKENFDSFINYLLEKQRCGVVNLSDNKYILYILSPCEFSQKFYINPKKHLLGILVDATVEPTRQQITIPPPVISLTEKRRLLSRNKKNENKKEKESEQEKIMKLKEELKKLEDIGDEQGIKNMEEFIKQNPDFKKILDKL